MDELRRFLVAHYRADLALTARDAFRWQYRAGADEADVACAWDGDRLVGTMGYIAFPAFWGTTDHQVDMAWLANWMVDPAYRQGAGVALLRAMQERFPILAAFGATAENERLVTLLGWALHPQVPRWYAIVDAPACVALSLPGADRTAIGAAVVEPADHPVTTRDPIEDGLDCNWASYAPCRYGTIRSRDFIAWRYRRHPAFHYDVLAVGPPGNAAIAVVRVEDVSGSSSRVLRVLEFFHPDDSAGRRHASQLLDALVRRARTAECAFAEWTGSQAAINATFERAGWTREVPGAELLPGRYRPPERRPFALNLELGVARGYELPPLETLYVTRGNGDADRAGSVRDLRSAPEAAI